MYACTYVAETGLFLVWFLVNFLCICSKYSFRQLRMYLSTQSCMSNIEYINQSINQSVIVNVLTCTSDIRVVRYPMRHKDKIEP